MWGRVLAWVLRLLGRGVEAKEQADRAESDKIHQEAREQDPEDTPRATPRARREP